MTQQPVTFSSEEELALLAELLDAEQTRLLVGIRHTFHREYRDELHRKLNLVGQMIKDLTKAT